ncbi:two-component system regulatory protein YycI [Paenibacillus assamensis]|uniref:two-component system regulatory protein YycI n=1 Tax=Paenibacillus assamensis TaxID=311244 RepID=UPI0003FEC521|nr:two-component system regulatory protein YycI [Paenibacillus assamensis]
MDWGRAKSILIYAFLALNIVLGYQLWQDIRDRMHSDKDWRSLSAETIRTMEEKQIQIKGPIPSETPSLREITYRYTVKQDQPVPLIREELGKVVFSHSETIAALEDEIQHIEEYWYDDSYRDNMFVLHQMMPTGYPIFDVRLDLFYDNQKITGYRQQYMELVESDEAPAQTVLPASKALGKLIEDHLPSGSVIKSVKLGYHGQQFDTDIQVAAPVWRVVLENGNDIFYVSANNAAVEHYQVDKKEKEA